MGKCAVQTEGLYSLPPLFHFLTWHCRIRAGCFTTALKRSPSFAPAFSDLGIYYSEAANPPDPNRASKCFQKAFELDATQADAARRLAESFAEEREWDLVEVVARRTIEGEGWNEPASSKNLPVNSWAWKAFGVVELVSFPPDVISAYFHLSRAEPRNYPAAIQSLQTSLRGEPDDQLGWYFLCGLPAVRELYQYANDPRFFIHPTDAKGARLKAIDWQLEVESRHFCKTVPVKLGWPTGALILTVYPIVRVSGYPQPSVTEPGRLSLVWNSRG